jgi:hypothetical protein
VQPCSSPCSYPVKRVRASLQKSRESDVGWSPRRESYPRVSQIGSKTLLPGSQDSRACATETRPKLSRTRDSSDCGSLLHPSSAKRNTQELVVAVRQVSSLTSLRARKRVVSSWAMRFARAHSQCSKLSAVTSHRIPRTVSPQAIQSFLASCAALRFQSSVRLRLALLMDSRC